MLASLLVAALLGQPGEAPAISVVPSVGSAAISDARAAQVAKQVAAALAASGFTLTDRDPEAVVTVEAGEVRDNVALAVRAALPGQSTPLATASFLLQKKDGHSVLVARLADFARALRAGLPRQAPAVESAREPVPEPTPEPAPEPTPEPTPEPMPEPAPPEGPPEESPEEPTARESGPIVFARVDGDVLGGFGAGVGAGYTFGAVGLEATLLLPKSVTGVRLELRVLPFEFARIRPFASVGATCFFASGWGGRPGGGEAVFALGPRGALGAELRVSGLRIRADVAVEGFVARSPGDFRGLAVLVGGAAGWQF